MSPDRPSPPPSSPAPQPQRDPLARLAELQADRAVQGLSAAESAELQALIDRHGLRDDDAMERAAAAAHLAMSADEPREQMPLEVRERLLRAGRAWASQGNGGGSPVLDDLDDALIDRKLRFPGPVQVRPRAGRLLATWGGWLAAAACITVMATYSTRNPATPPDPGGVLRDLADLSPVASFDRLDERLASGEQVVSVSAESDGYAADLRFDPDKRQGCLAIAGLDVSDSSDKQYQVWLLDEGRTYPVNAGVFDVSSSLQGAKIVVPLRTLIPVRSPAGIAVSVEDRGGVVLPDPGRIIFKAAMPQVGPPAPSESLNDV